MKKRYFFLLLALLSFTAVRAQMTIENLLNVPFPTDLCASPDGEHIAWVFNDQGVRNIFLASAPEFQAEQITSYSVDEGQEIASLTFTADGNKIVFVRGGAANRQREFPNPLTLQQEVEQAIWVIDRDGSNLRKIGPGASPTLSPDGKTLAYIKEGQVFDADLEETGEGKQLFKSRGNQTSLTWSPDGSKLAFVSRRGDHSFLGILDLDSHTITFMDPSVDHDLEPAWSADGRQIAFIRNPNRRKNLPFSPQREGLPWSIRVGDVATGESTEIWEAPKGKGSIFHSLPGSKSLFWIGEQLIFPWEGDGWLHLYAINTDGGEPQLLTPGEGEVESAHLNRQKNSLLYVSNIGDIDRRHIWTISSQDQKPRQLTIGEGIEWAPAETVNGLAYLGSDATTPAWPYLQADEDEGQKIFEEAFPDFFTQDELVVPQAIMVTATDGMEIPAQLFLPKDAQPGQKGPALIFTHGGPMRQMLLGFHYGLYYHHFYAMNQYFANQGYVVMSLNYRSGIGYGMEFREAEDRGAAGASEYQDLEGAGLYLANREDVDPGRIALWGGSYGGYLTALGLARSPELFATGVDIHGVHDWNEVVRNFVPTYDSEKRKAFAATAFEASPMHYIDNWRGPVLVIHGDDDRNVPFSETVSLVEELRERDVHVEQLIFPDEVHSFLLHRNWIRAFRASVEFLNQQFGIEVSNDNSLKAKDTAK